MTDEQQEDPEKLTRRERRAKAKTGSTDSESVKDRNQRLRAEAAAKRRSSRESEREAAAAAGLDASERMDDALVRSADATGRFVRNNFAWLQWIVVLGIAGAIAILIVNYRRAAEAQKRGHRVASALAGEFAKVASTEPNEETNLVDPRKEYATAQEKHQKALEGWRELSSSSKNEIALIARLAAAHALSDLGRYSEARAAYEAIEKDPGSASTLDVRARAVEGIGLAFESEGKFAEAKKAFERLGNLEGSLDLSKFHVARAEVLMGNREEARKILAPLDEKLSKNSPPEGPTDYLGAAVRDLLKTVDPGVAAKELALLKKRQEAEQQERFREMIEQMQKRAGKDGNPLLPGLPALPTDPSEDKGAFPEEPVEDDATSPPAEKAAPSPVGPAKAPSTRPTIPSSVPSSTPVERSAAPQAPATPRAPATPQAPAAPAPVPAPKVPTAPAPQAPAAPAPAPQSTSAPAPQVPAAPAPAE